MGFAYLYKIGFRFDQAHLAYPYVELPEELKAIPGFTVLNERKYMRLFSSYLYTNKGYICELGCTFGSLTASLASGLKKGSKKIHSYDIFTWHKSFGDILYQTEFKDTLEYGKSFQHVFNHYTSKYDSHIEASPTDINKVLWDEGKAIEFLLVDAMKSEFLADAILKKFYKHLELGSIVYQQDFCHFHEPWIHLIHYKFKDNFTFVCHIEDTPSAVFKMNKTIEPEKLQEGFSLNAFSIDQIHESFDFSASLIKEEPARQNVLAAKSYCLFACHFFKEANLTLSKVLDSYEFVEKGNLEFVVKIAEQVKKDETLILEEMNERGKNLLTDLDYITNATLD